MASPKRRKDHSPLDARLQSLKEEEETVRRLMEEKQRLIDDAPGIAKQQETNRRKEVASRDSLVFSKLKATMTDSRGNFSGGGSRSKPLRRQTRRERHELRMRFFLLLVIVVCLVGWLIHMMS